MDLGIDLFFTADIFINFRSAWIDTGGWEGGCMSYFDESFDVA